MSNRPPSGGAAGGGDDAQNAAMMQQWLGDFRAIFAANQGGAAGASGGASGGGGSAAAAGGQAAGGSAAASGGPSAATLAYYQQLAAAAAASQGGGAGGGGSAAAAALAAAAKAQGIGTGAAPSSAGAAAPSGPPAAAAAAAGASGQPQQETAALVQWLLMQVGFMVDTHIKRARHEAEQNFKVELGKMKRDLTVLQQFSEKQGQVIASVSKDLASVRAEVARTSTSFQGCKMHCTQQHQLMHTIQLALNNVLKELEDVDKRVQVVQETPEMLGRAGQMELGYDGEYAAEGFSFGMDGIPHLDGRSAAATAAAEKAVAAVQAKAKAGDKKKLDAAAPVFIPPLREGEKLDAAAPEFVPGGLTAAVGGLSLEESGEK